MPGYLRIGELARRTGVPEATLRAWERRYSLLHPDRSAGGFRLYSDDDLVLVQTMQSQLRRGVAASEAARFALAGANADGPAGQALVDDLVEALERFDDVAAQAALDRTLSTLSVEAALHEVLLPAMQNLGRGWEEDPAAIAREHFATNVVRSRLLSLARGWDLGGGSRALLACAPDELHDVGLIAFGLALRARGWRITYLGPSTPLATLVEAAVLTKPELIVVSATMRRHLRGTDAELAKLALRHRLAIAGPGATEEMAAGVRAELLPSDPIAAAGSV